ncbi:hypothetical protein BXU06_06005 [Aquaspirillum sp. LM1]|uniref:LysR substrate-binding domain-containing protein n=1 Tax=Aquaspirillum sp. LM1 TaxID=1938604 RepID=UPI000983BDBB|nr:LysR substrate-binding domain-containing protein [Aquaspirillum sp. LM1]AQR64663.1 hypothetical protein BXU06_06005 [Aquaspirillum sp. LM1]
MLACTVDFGLVEGPYQHPELEVIPWLDDSEAIKRAAAAGLGVSCLSRRVVAELLASGALVELRADLPVLTRTLWRIHRRDRPSGAGLLGVLGSGPPHSECIANKRHELRFAPAANLLSTIRLCPIPT